MIAIITGASRGIGFETARYLGLIPGMKVFAISRNRKGLERLASGKEDTSSHETSIQPVVLDLEQFLDEPALIDTILHHGIEHVDILINNAGNLVSKPFEEMTLYEWERLYRINVFGPAMLVKALMPVLGKKGISHVVNIGSMGGYQGSVKYPGLAGYSSSKAALACMTECLGHEYKDSDIVFNCLALGSVQTEMLAKAFPGYKASTSPLEMAEFIGQFSLTGHKFFRGRIIPVSSSSP